MMMMILKMITMFKCLFSAIGFATCYSTRYSDFLSQPYSNPTRSQKTLLAGAWWLRVPHHNIEEVKVWISCLRRCSLKRQASSGERGSRAGLPNCLPSLISHCDNWHVWQRLERGEEERQLRRELFWENNLHFVCAVWMEEQLAWGDS